MLYGQGRQQRRRPVPVRWRRERSRQVKPRSSQAMTKDNRTQRKAHGRIERLA